MAILTIINGQPLFETVEEALSWAAQNNLTGYHIHDFQGLIGYMGGSSHEVTIASTSQGINMPNTVNNTGTTNSSSY